MFIKMTVKQVATKKSESSHNYNSKLEYAESFKYFVSTRNSLFLFLQLSLKGTKSIDSMRVRR